MFDSPINEIKSRLSITDVLGEYIELKKSGTNFKAVCPFHSEKTPSFMVSPAKQVWHCFGCGLGGDIFEFVKQIENVEFSEALKTLAHRAGVVLKQPTEEQLKQVEKKDVLVAINIAAAQYFARVLWESNAGAEALDYLRRRGLSDQTIKNWTLGYAPNDFHYLENHLSKKFNKKDIEEAGLIIKSDRDNSYFDRFHDRVMFPITNLQGQIVGFTGRLLHDKPNTGKYVNSPETLIYNKGQIIFGLYQARNAIRKEDRAVLVEGNMDVISAHQAGSNQAVATSGTALSAEQLNILSRFTQNLVFAFDSDSAGNTAARRALEMALNAGFNVKIIDLGGAKDPDELIKKGINVWLKAVESAGNFVDFFFNQSMKQYDPHSVEGKRDIAKDLTPLIYRITDPITRSHYVRKLSQGLNVAESAILDIMNRLSLPKPLKTALKSEKRKNRIETLEEKLLGLSLLLKLNKYVEGPVSDFHPSLQGLVNIILTESDPSLITQKNPELQSQVQLLTFVAETQIKEQEFEALPELEKTAKELKRERIKARMQVLPDLIKGAEEANDLTRASALAQEHINLTQQLNKL